MIAFVHIPKTGGTSVEAAFKQLYGEENCFFTTKWQDGEHMLRNPENFQRFAVVGGHLPIHYFANLPIRHYVSLFRKPIARYVSHYRHMLRTKEHPLHENAAALSLKEFVQFDERPNEQCWYFEEDRACFVLDKLTAPPIMILGLMEQMDEFRACLSYYLGVDFPEIPKLNVAVGEMLIEPRVADDIAQRIRQDLELYEHLKVYVARVKTMRTKGA